MSTDHYERILELETTPESLDATVSYLSRLIKPFLQTLEPVLICFPDEGPASLGGIFKAAVLRCEASPVFWGPDYRWKELLRIAFDTHANTLIGAPEVVLGLMKLANATGTPLYVYDVIVAGDPFPRWMVDGLKKGLDCSAWGCYCVNSGPVIGGFSCEQEAGIHIRPDVFVPHLDQQDDVFMNNQGKLSFTYAKDSSLIFDPQQNAILQHQPCSCGCDDIRVVAVSPTRNDDMSKSKLDEKLLTWSSVLDYQVSYTEFGAALELVVFPGYSIPKLPNFAKQNVRIWNPAEDIPFCMRQYIRKNT